MNVLNKNDLINEPTVFVFPETIYSLSNSSHFLDVKGNFTVNVKFPSWCTKKKKKKKEEEQKKKHKWDPYDCSKTRKRKSFTVFFFKSCFKMIFREDDRLFTAHTLCTDNFFAFLNTSVLITCHWKHCTWVTSDAILSIWILWPNTSRLTVNFSTEV